MVAQVSGMITGRECYQRLQRLTILKAFSNFWLQVWSMETKVWLNWVFCTKVITKLALSICNNEISYAHQLAHDTKKLLHTFEWEEVEHPPYSPDFAPCNFHVFGRMTKPLAKLWYYIDEKLQHGVWQWLPDGYRTRIL